VQAKYNCVLPTWLCAGNLAEPELNRAFGLAVDDIGAPLRLNAERDIVCLAHFSPLKPLASGGQSIVVNAARASRAGYWEAGGLPKRMP
jgi:hypothetical protein